MFGTSVGVFVFSLSSPSLIGIFILLPVFSSSVVLLPGVIIFRLLLRLLLVWGNNMFCDASSDVASTAKSSPSC